VISQFDGQNADIGGLGRGGSRSVEDLLLPNVHEFRVEIWDARLGQYVVPGYGTVSGTGPESVGDYHIRRNLQANIGANRFEYGPLAPYTPSNTDPTQQPHIFDTWHPGLAADSTFDRNSDTVAQLHEISPPYIAYRFTPPLAPNGPTPSLIPNPAGSEISRVRIFNSNLPSDVTLTNQGYWQANNGYAVNQLVFPPWVDSNTDTLFDYSEIAEPKFNLGYRCVTAGTSAGAPPTRWPTTPGQRITDGTVQWEAVDNRRPLSSIRVTIRFQEPSSEQMRQVTQILSLTDDE
ncbi:MAG: hypothetical protein KDA91_07560, partial [Planctomycetaceae bacterium]|nr:hypothetical protein [Planctomycetaceae bacterium]